MFFFKLLVWSDEEPSWFYHFSLSNKFTSKGMNLVISVKSYNYCSSTRMALVLNDEIWVPLNKEIISWFLRKMNIVFFFVLATEMGVFGSPSTTVANFTYSYEIYNFFWPNRMCELLYWNIPLYFSIYLGFLVMFISCIKKWGQLNWFVWHVALYKYILSMLIGLFSFQSISTLVGYLIPNPGYIYIYIYACMYRYILIYM